ncbi:MAG TPA: hypothetical protein VHM28_10845 [Anaerolineales bacterium]|jgi:hypothetical protein|nr:hypothetical protein [Anaerolineales bacterium]
MDAGFRNLFDRFRGFFGISVLTLLFVAGVQLFILSEHTDIYFSWKIPSPFTAAFLGAGYWAALFAIYFASRDLTWASARTSLLPSALATTLMGITSFIYIDKFSWQGPQPITVFVTWVWFIVYIVGPLFLIALWIVQMRIPRDGSSESHPLPAWVRGGLFVLATLFLLAGIGLFAMPTTIATFWPWKVVALSGRAMSAWLIAYGSASWLVARENDRVATVGTMWSLAAFSVLQFIVIARYPATLNWGNLLAWIYVIALLAGLIFNAAGLWSNRKAS